jgi:hypothetical protein
MRNQRFAKSWVLCLAMTLLPAGIASATSLFFRIDRRTAVALQAQLPGLPRMRESWGSRVFGKKGSTATFQVSLRGSKSDRAQSKQRVTQLVLERGGKIVRRGAWVGKFLRAWGAELEDAVLNSTGPVPW